MELNLERARALFVSLAPVIAWLKRMTQGEQLKGNTPCGASQQ